MTEKRVLPKEDIPRTIWDDKCLSLPALFVERYEEVLKAHGLLSKALGPHVTGHVGGPTEQETKDHFAYNFINSGGRVVYAVCSPCDKFVGVSDTLLEICSYGSITLLDLPCGTGALSSALVSLLVELRKHGTLPTEPLTITILGADHSEPSRKIFEEVLQGLVESADQVAITLKTKVLHWDLTGSDDTARLIDTWFTSSTEANDHLVGILNFHGALNGDIKESAASALGHLSSRLYNRQGAIFWLEPAHIPGHKTKVQKVRTWLCSLNNRFGPSNQEHDLAERTARFLIKNPLAAGPDFISGVTLMHLNPLTRNLP